MMKNIGIFTCRLMAIFVLTFSVMVITSDGRQAYAQDSAGSDSDSSPSFWETIWNTTTDTVGSIANSFFTPIGNTASAAGS